MDIQEKKGIIKDVELAENADNALRLVVETAEIVDISNLADVEDVTDFVLSNKQQTKFSTLMNVPEGVKVDALAKALKGKNITLVICSETIEKLSNGTITRVKYERQSDGETRKTRTMSRTYVKGQKGISDAFEALQDELRRNIDDGTFEDVSNEEEKPESKPAEKPKAKF